MNWLNTAGASSLALLSLAGLAGLGCTVHTPDTTVPAGPSDSTVTMADSFDLDLFGPHADDLHAPYVAGAKFEITVNGNTAPGWTLASSDPNVIRVTSPLSGGIASVAAVNPGQAALIVADATGKVLDSHAVSVAIPDQVDLYAEGPLVTGASDAAAHVTQVRVVAGGVATFLVRYLSHGTELSGSGALQVSPSSGIATSVETGTTATARDFLRVASLVGAGTTGTVSLLIDQVAVGALPITVVDPAAVTRVDLVTRSAAGAQNGAFMSIYAHAEDKTGDVYGAFFGWSIDGQPLGPGNDAGVSDFSGGGPADLFFYTYDSSVSETVKVSYDGFSPTTVVHAKGGSAEVASTATTPAVDCSVGAAPGSPLRSSAGFIGLLVAGVAVLRRRRARA